MLFKGFKETSKTDNQFEVVLPLMNNFRRMQNTRQSRFESEKTTKQESCIKCIGTDRQKCMYSFLKKR